MARDEFNIAADKMAHDNIFGVGLNNFSHVLTITPKYNEHIEVMKNEEQAGVAHHIYLLTAAEMGYAGLLVFLVIIARFVFIAFRFFRSSKSIEGSLAFGIGLGFCALHASGFLEWALRITPVTYMFTIICGVLVSIAKYETILEKPETV
jgi:O-antigen ligase